MSGRMVIRLRPDLKGLQNSSQDIEVRDGDVLEIPKEPGIVLVVGQVYNSNAITYVAGKNAGWYLSESGGATKLADKNAIFIVRANGEIRSRDQGGWWSHGVLSAVGSPWRHDRGTGTRASGRYPLEKHHCASADRGGRGNHCCGCLLTRRVRMRGQWR